MCIRDSLCISYLIFAYHQIPSSLFCWCSSLAHTSLLLYVVNELSFPACFHLPRLCLCHPQTAGCLFLFRVPIFLFRHLWLCPWLSLDPRWTQWVILDLLVLYPCWLQTSFLLAHILSLLPEHCCDVAVINSGAAWCERHPSRLGVISLCWWFCYARRFDDSMH